MTRRSILFSPGDQPDLQRKAPHTGADVVVFDLEDAVAPDRKHKAREATHGVLTDDDFDPDCEVCVRVNPGETAAVDLNRILDGDPRLDSVMLPKVSEANDVSRLSDCLNDQDTELPILALIESATGVLNVDFIADAWPTDAVCFGAEDLAADLGATRTREGTEVLYARERVVMAAAAAGIDAIDTLVTDFSDEERLQEGAAFSVQLGYDGKLAIHPSQVGPINDAFTPNTEEVEWAEQVLTARDEAANADRGVFEVDGEMIDAPLIAQAERIVRRASATEVR